MAVVQIVQIRLARAGAKLVRGAYMYLERERAAKKGYPSPIWPTIEQTHANFDRRAPCPGGRSLSEHSRVSQLDSCRPSSGRRMHVISSGSSTAPSCHVFSCVV